MNEFLKLIEEYLAARIDLKAVERGLIVALSRQPHLAAAFGARVEGLYRGGRVNGEVYLALVQAIRTFQQSQAANAAVAAATAAAAPTPTPPASTPDAPREAGADSAPDKTQFRPRAAAQAAAPPEAAEADKTHFRPRAPASAAPTPEAEGDKTHFRPRAAPQAEPAAETGEDRTRLRPRPAAPSGTPGPAAAPAGAAAAAASGGDPSWTPRTGGASSSTTGSSTGSSRVTGSSTWGDTTGGRLAAADAPILGPGSVIKERFILEEELGRGGMGLVFKARDLRKEEAQDRNPYVAVKVLNEEFRRHPESLKALQRESRKAQNLAHPNVVTVYDFDRDGGNVFMVMELLEGEALDRLIRRTQGQGLELKEALRITRDICRAMAYAHEQGVVHSDFKPGNAFLTREGTVKVFDFGIARAAKRSDKAGGTTTLFDPSTLGAMTPAYASCEMIEGLEPDPRDDIYAIACVAYELLTGRHPFDRKSAVQARDAGLVPRAPPKLPRGQWRALQRGLAFGREQRSPSVMAFLNGVLPPKRSPAVYVGAGAAALAVIVIAAVVIPNLISGHRETSMINTLAHGSALEIERTLPKLRELDAVRRNAILANDEARNGLINYYQAGILAAFDATNGHYDFPRAQGLADDLLKFLPDSNKVKGINDELGNRKNDAIKQQSDRFDSDIDKGLLIPAQGAQNTEAVLAIVRSIDRNHALLHDPRLPGAYAKQTKEALLRGDASLAQALVASGLKFSPDDAALRDLSDQAERMVHVQQAEARVARLERSLGALLGGAATLADLEGRRADISELRSLNPQNTTLVRVQDSAQRAIERQLQSLQGAQRFDDAQKFLDRDGDLAGPAFIESRHAQLIAAQLAYQNKANAARLIAQQRDAAIAGIKTIVDGLLKAAHPDDAWEANLRSQLQKLAAYLQPTDPYIAQVRSTAAARYVSEGRALRAQQRLAEAGHMLDRAREYAPQSPDVASEDRLLADARRTTQLATDARNREAQLAALKQKLIDQAQANDVSEAQASLAELKKAKPDDVFVAKEAPQAIGGAYGRLALSAVREGRYDRAVELLSRASDVAPQLADLAATRDRYTRYAALDRQLSSGTALSADSIRRDLDQITKLNAAESSDVRDHLARTLVARISATRGDQSAALLNVAKAVFPRDAGVVRLAAARAAPAPAAAPPPAPVPATSPPTAPGTATPATAPALAEEQNLVAGSKSAPTAASPPGTAPTVVASAQPSAALGAPGTCSAGLAGYGRRGRGVCFDTFAAGHGPELVVVPAPPGGRVFAIGRTELSNKDFALYCKSTGKCAVPPGSPELPVTSISVAEARRYLEWLSQTSGATYRLPTDAEWTFAANAQGAADPGGLRSVNCVMQANGTQVAGFSLQNVTSGTPNAWGLYNYAGNAQEWVQTGGAVTARGGAYSDPLSQCTASSSRPHSGNADPVTGFRVLREIK